MGAGQAKLFEGSETGMFSLFADAVDKTSQEEGIFLPSAARLWTASVFEQLPMITENLGALRTNLGTTQELLGLVLGTRNAALQAAVGKGALLMAGRVIRDRGTDNPTYYCGVAETALGQACELEPALEDWVLSVAPPQGEPREGGLLTDTNALEETMRGLGQMRQEDGRKSPHVLPTIVSHVGSIAWLIEMVWARLLGERKKTPKKAEDRRSHLILGRGLVGDS